MTRIVLETFAKFQEDRQGGASKKTKFMLPRLQADFLLILKK